MTKTFLLFLACIAASATAGHAETQKERTVAAIEDAGCVVDRSNINEIFDGPGLADDDFRVMGEALIAEGRAQVSDAGAFHLTASHCI